MNKLVKKERLDWMDWGFILLMTVVGLAIRLQLRTVTTVDWTMYWDPWLATLKEQGFAALATDFYDYAPPFVYILWVISRLPVNPMTAFKGLMIVVDFIAAIVMGKIVWEGTGSRVKSICTYGLFLVVPTIWANSALWAQCDIIFMTFVMLCIYELFRDKPGRAMFFYGIAFAFKLQSLFIFPFLVILWVNKKIRLQHFLWIPVMYFVGILPAWIAGRPLSELIAIYAAQGAQDVWSLSIKWPNIYQIIGNQFFLLEYAEAGTFLILGILMCVMFWMAQRKYKVTKEFIIQLALFFAILCPYVLPHMHERYGCLADILAIIYAVMNRKRFFVPIVQITMSFNSYMAYLSHLGADEPPMYYGVWAFIELGLLVIIGLDLYRYFADPRNRAEAQQAPVAKEQKNLAKRRKQYG